MPNDFKSEKEIQEMLRAIAHHAWTHPKDEFARRREFENAGIRSEGHLKETLERAIKDPAARSFDRLPSPGQKEKSIFLDVKIVDEKKKEHHLTVVLNPERDDQGRLKTGGTVYINDLTERSGFSRNLEREYREGKDPKVVLRGPDLSRSPEQSLKTPFSRLDGNLENLPKPTHEREKQVTPKQKAQEQQRQTKGQMTLLEKLQQQKPDLSKEIAERQRNQERDRSLDLSR